MNRKSILAALAFFPLGVTAQGTFNASNSFIPPGGSRAYLICGGWGEPMPKARGRVMIVHNAPGLPILSPNGQAGVPLTLDGLFFINGLVVPGVQPNECADLIVQAWDVASGPTWDSAVVKNMVDVRICQLGGPDTPPATFAANSNFFGMELEWCPYPTWAGLQPLVRNERGRWLIRGTADADAWAKFYGSTNLIDWELVGYGWVSTGIGFFPKLPYGFQFEVPESDFPARYFKVVW